MDQDIRWQQRFNNFKKALVKLSEAVDQDFTSLSELEVEGLIQRFEYTYELAWKTMQDYLRINGYQEISGPTPVLEQALQAGIIKDGDGWKRMKKSRELSSHTYDEHTAAEIASDIVTVYHNLFIQLETRLEVERLS